MITVKLNKTKLRNIIPLASMSDIAFLLLIFIILISLSGGKKAIVDLPDSKSNIREDKEDCINVILCSSDVLIDKISTGDIKENIVHELKKKSQKSRIKIIADKELSFIKIKQILKILERENFKKIQFVVKNN